MNLNSSNRAGALITGLNDLAENLQGERQTEVRRAIMDFSLRALTHFGGKGENVLFSPVSALSVLAMMSDGADGNTKSELERLCGANADELFDLFRKVLLPDADTSKYDASLTLANAAVVNENEHITITGDFLDKYTSSPFAELISAKTEDEICLKANDFAKRKTDGQISEIMSKAPDDFALSLLNATCFKGEWDDKRTIITMDSHFDCGDESPLVSMLLCQIGDAYLNGRNARGFIKPYCGEKYCFAAIVPDADTPLPRYLESLTADELLDMLTPEERTVTARFPKLSVDTELNLREFSEAFGVSDAFDNEKADFSRLAVTNHIDKNIRVDGFSQKSVLELNETGTVAAAVTRSCLEPISGMDDEIIDVCITRPFIYMIIEKKNKLPIFIGTTENPDILHLVNK